MKGTRVLITGGAGELGTGLVDALFLRDADIMVLDLREGTRKDIAAEVVNVIDPSAHEHVLRFHPDIVVHLAGNSDEAASHTDPEADAENTILGTLNMLHAAKLAGAKRFVFASSDAARGDAPVQVAPRPHSPYGVSKLAGERYCGAYFAMYGLPFVALRLPEDGSVNAVAELVAAIEGKYESVINL